MNATKVEQVLAACEAGFVLPQKSTYFQPKLATGLVMYRLDGAAPRPRRERRRRRGDDRRRRHHRRHACGRAASASSSRRAARA